MISYRKIRKSILDDILPRNELTEVNNSINDPSYPKYRLRELFVRLIMENFSLKGSRKCIRFKRKYLKILNHNNC